MPDMHKLDRTAIPAPACLANYDPARQRWEEITLEDKRLVRRSLVQLQGERCAYCEGPPYREGHIEHFRRKNPAHFPQLTFQWDNLFLACGSQEHCGHYKDRPGAPAYNPSQLIKPDVDDPDDFLYFHSSGEVRVRSSVTQEQDAVRARETIRVFNLNEGALKAARRRAVRIYLDRDASILDALLAFAPPERQVFIDDEVQATRADPFCTTIRHLFEAVH